MPPIESTPKLTAASATLNAPVSPAATAKRNSTMPVASLDEAFPSSSTIMRGGSRTRASTALAATASGGDTMAPSAKHAAHGRDGTAQCADDADQAVVNATAPIASCRMMRRLARKSRHTVKNALASSSGGRNSTMARSGSSRISGTPE